MAYSSKKTAFLRILQILKDETDAEHTLTHNEIAQKLYSKYGIEIERKTVASNISLLKECGYDIVTNCGIEKVTAKNGGNYLREKDFEDSEIKLLIDAVIFSQYISEKHSIDLIKKLTKLSNKYFKIHNKNFLSLKNEFKTDSKEVFFNMELIDEAIDKKKKITYFYVKLNENKEKTINSQMFVSPYGYVLHNQKYYLFGYSDNFENICFHRLAWIEDVEIMHDDIYDPYMNIKNIPEFKNGVSYENLIASRPYMFTDKPQKIVLKVNNKIINDIFDWFGKNVLIKKENEDFSIVSFNASTMAMKFWAMQYMDAIEIISPISLREDIISSLINGIKKYLL